MNKNWQVIFALLGIFLMGSIAGGFVGARLTTKKVVQGKVAEQFTVQQLRRFADQLELTREQRDRIRPIILRTGNDVRELRKDIAATLDRMDHEIKRQLTEEQQKKFDQLRADQSDRERRLQKWVQDQRKLRGEARQLETVPAAQSTPSPPAK